ncbi:MAG: hypothetical protein WBR26_21570 [Candidatus Acidiferrum sp.]
MQRETIVECFPDDLGRLRYFGLPSTALGDAIEWQDLFTQFVAVERGQAGSEWEMQHDLELTAFRSGVFDRVTLLRGEIDSIIHRKKDAFGNRLRFPFDVVSLDYSGGLFYRDRKGTFTRLRAIEETIQAQSKAKTNFVLLISCNLDSVDQGEVRKTIDNIRTELVRYGITGDKVLEAYLNSRREECRLKLYFPFFVNTQASKFHYNCETKSVIFYEGNLATPMMAFRFWLSFDLRTESLRPPRERFSQIFNKPMLHVVNGTPQETMLDMPKLVALDSNPS